MIVQFIGLKKLSEDEISILSRISKIEKKKIERDLENSKLILVIKKEDRGGKRARYIIEAKIDNPSTIYKAQVEEWDLAKATHKIFTRLEQEIQHKLQD